MHLYHSRVEFYRCICSTPLWSSTESKISQYVYYRSICRTPLWSSTESKISQYVYYRSICSIPLWSSTESKIIIIIFIDSKTDYSFMSTVFNCRWKKPFSTREEDRTWLSRKKNQQMKEKRITLYIYSVECH